MQRLGIVSILKLLAVVIVGLVIVKVSSSWLSTKFPNKLTSSMDAVVQKA